VCAIGAGDKSSEYYQGGLGIASSIFLAMLCTEARRAPDLDPRRQKIAESEDIASHQTNNDNVVSLRHRQFDSAAQRQSWRPLVSKVHCTNNTANQNPPNQSSRLSLHHPSCQHHQFAGNEQHEQAHPHSLHKNPRITRRLAVLSVCFNRSDVITPATDYDPFAL